MPLSLISTQSIDAVCVSAGVDPCTLRFRPNLVVEALDGTEFAEDTWVGSVLRIGGLRLRVDKRDQRCVMINVDPDTCERSAEVLRAVTRERGACVGVYGSTVQPGRIAVGDPVVVEG